MNSDDIQDLINSMISRSNMKEHLIQNFGIEDDEADIISEEAYDYVVSSDDTFQFIKRLLSDYDAPEETDEYLGFSIEEPE